MELIHVYCFFLAQNVRESPGMLAHGIILVKSIIRTYIYIYIYIIYNNNNNDNNDNNKKKKNICIHVYI